MAYNPQSYPSTVVAADRYAEHPPPYRDAGLQHPPYQGYAQPQYGGQYGSGPQPGYDAHATIFVQPVQDHVTGYTSYGGQGPQEVGEDDMESPFKGSSANWSERAVRHAFVRKVYLLVFTMLATCIAMTSVFMLVDSVRHYVRTSSWIFWVSWVVGFGALIALACCESARRRTPTNYILLTVFTLAESFMVATVCAWYQAEEVLIAMGITAGVVLAVTVFACQVKFDFTGWAVYLWGITWALLLFGIFAIIFRSRVVNIVYAGIGAVLFSIYLIVDTQLIMGGKNYEISPEEYVFAAMAIFLDIINIFIMILSLLGQTNN